MYKSIFCLLRVMGPSGTIHVIKCSCKLKVFREGSLYTKRHMNHTKHTTNLGLVQKNHQIKTDEHIHELQLWT